MKGCVWGGVTVPPVTGCVFGGRVAIKKGSRRRFGKGGRLSFSAVSCRGRLDSRFLPFLPLLEGLRIMGHSLEWLLL
jgi:hypothetical protein